MFKKMQFIIDIKKIFFRTNKVRTGSNKRRGDKIFWEEEFGWGTCRKKTACWREDSVQTLCEVFPYWIGWRYIEQKTAETIQTINDVMKYNKLMMLFW